MNQQKPKTSIKKRLRAWISRRRIESVYLILVVAGIFAVYYLLIYGEETSTNFMISFSAGILGIMAGLSLDKKREQIRDERTKKDFLALMRSELAEIKRKIPPQTNTPLMLYPEVWDSFVASGLMRLLNAEQVTKLSRVYRFVKGTQYEAEWVRRRVEEHEGLPDTMKAEKEFLKRRCMFLQASYEGHGKELTKEIDKILEEAWLS